MIEVDDRYLSEYSKLLQISCVAMASLIGKLFLERFMSLINMPTNGVEQLQEPIRLSEWGMRRFKSPSQAQRFLGVHAAVYNLFNLDRLLVAANHYRDLRKGEFSECSRAAA
jgi:putative transposase